MQRTWPDKQSTLPELGRILGFPPLDSKSPPPPALRANSLKLKFKVESVSVLGEGLAKIHWPVAAGVRRKAEIAQNRKPD